MKCDEKKIKSNQSNIKIDEYQTQTTKSSFNPILDQSKISANFLKIKDFSFNNKNNSFPNIIAFFIYKGISLQKYKIEEQNFMMGN